MIEKIVQKLYALLEAKVAEVLKLVNSLPQSKERSTSQELPANAIREGEEFEEIIDRLANEFQMLVRANVTVLSDYAVSRSGIYEETE